MFVSTDDGVGDVCVCLDVPTGCVHLKDFCSNQNVLRHRGTVFAVFEHGRVVIYIQHGHNHSAGRRQPPWHALVYSFHGERVHGLQLSIQRLLQLDDPG